MTSSGSSVSVINARSSGEIGARAATGYDREISLSETAGDVYGAFIGFVSGAQARRAKDRYGETDVREAIKSLGELAQDSEHSPGFIALQVLDHGPLPRAD